MPTPIGQIYDPMPQRQLLPNRIANATGWNFGAQPTVANAGQNGGYTYGMDSSGTSSFGPTPPQGALNPATLQALQAMGWSGGDPIDPGGGGNQDQAPGARAWTPEFQQWAQAHGITSSLMQAPDQGSSGMTQHTFIGPDGQIIGQPTMTNLGNDKMFWDATLLAAAGMGGAAGLATEGGAGAAAASDLAGAGVTGAGYGGEALTAEQLAAGGAAGGAAGTGGVTGIGIGGTSAATGDVAGSAAAQVGQAAGAGLDTGAGTITGGTGLSAGSGALGAGGQGLTAAQLAAYGGGTGGGTGLFGLTTQQLIGGSSIISGLASLGAGAIQANAANNAADALRQQNAITQANSAPYLAAGKTALGSIADLMGTSGNTSAPNYGSLTHQFNASDLNSNLAPNYQFQLQQGLGATTNAGNAAGFSGNTLKGINDYAQGTAAGAYQQAYNNYTNNQTNIYNRLSNLAGLGQTANQITANAGTANVTGAGNFATSGGASAAAGLVGATNALTSGANNSIAYNTPSWNYLSGYQGSDVRLKTDIALIGETRRGLPLYSWRYKAGGGTRIGPMAQDVEKVRPDAVLTGPDGYKRVNYNLIREM